MTGRRASSVKGTCAAPYEWELADIDTDKSPLRAAPTDTKAGAHCLLVSTRKRTRQEDKANNTNTFKTSGPVLAADQGEASSSVQVPTTQLIAIK
jgi:hypothetical protein